MNDKLNLSMYHIQVFKMMLVELVKARQRASSSSEDQYISL